MLEKDVNRCIIRHYKTLEASQKLPRGCGFRHKHAYGELPLEFLASREILRHWRVSSGHAFQSSYI
jgi:hypothetical protein